MSPPLDRNLTFSPLEPAISTMPLPIRATPPLTTAPLSIWIRLPSPLANSVPPLVTVPLTIAVPPLVSMIAPAPTVPPFSVRMLLVGRDLQCAPVNVPILARTADGPGSANHVERGEARILPPGPDRTEIEAAAARSAELQDVAAAADDVAADAVAWPERERIRAAGGLEDDRIDVGGGDVPRIKQADRRKAHEYADITRYRPSIGDCADGARTECSQRNGGGLDRTRR